LTAPAMPALASAASQKFPSIHRVPHASNLLRHVHRGRLDGLADP
jgi:hypothetical protein